ncbi:MAG: hypothetical protein U0869_03895 [Chloroflexota bacterium]
MTRAKQVVDWGADLVYVHYGGDSFMENPAGDDWRARSRWSRPPCRCPSAS